MPWLKQLEVGCLFYDDIQDVLVKFTQLESLKVKAVFSKKVEMSWWIRRYSEADEESDVESDKITERQPSGGDSEGDSENDLDAKPKQEYEKNHKDSKNDEGQSLEDERKLVDQDKPEESKNNGDVSDMSLGVVEENSVEEELESDVPMSESVSVGLEKGKGSASAENGEKESTSALDLSDIPSSEED